MDDMLPVQLLWTVLAGGALLGFVARAVLKIHWLLSALAASAVVLLGFAVQAMLVHGVDFLLSGPLAFFAMFALIALPPALAGAGASAFIFRRRN